MPSVTTLNKLIRDNIPEIISSQGKTPVTKELDPEAYKEALLKKLFEEVEEVRNAEGEDRLEELADLLELIKAIAALDDASLDDIERIRKEKAEKRGGFDKRILLVEVQEP